jgi:hypothetical protein
LKRFTTDSGTIAPLVAGYLALILLTLFGSAAVGVTMIATNRVQGITDATVLFAHDRSIVRGIPDQGRLQQHAAAFLVTAQSAKRIRVLNYQIASQGALTELTLCAGIQNPLWALGEITICRSARAESFIVP